MTYPAYINKQIVLLEILDNKSTNGVSRYVDMLILGLSTYQYSIVYIKFLTFSRIILPQIIPHSTYTEIQIPLPVFVDEILVEDYWNREYCKIVFLLIQEYLSEGCILHIQTMNLIYLSLYIKKMKKCKLVTHIHCIPWKYLYSIDYTQFCYIYKKLLRNKKSREFSNYFPSKEELQISLFSDSIICVTQNAVQYIIQVLQTQPSKVTCIYNGINDYYKKAIFPRHPRNEFKILFVGRVSEEKGIKAILKAVKKISYNDQGIKILIAGDEDSNITKNLDEESKYLNIERLGSVSFEQLQELYKTCDIGIIPSYFEQCSYVALEMLSFGLPIIYTNVDGLREIFDGNCAIPISIDFSVNKGFSININELREKIELLKNNYYLRNEISKKARQRFLDRFQLKYMIEQTTDIYNKLFSAT